MSSENNKRNTHILIAIIIILVIIYLYKNKSTSEGLASQPAVILFTRSTSFNSLACAVGNGDNDACASYVFARLPRWYGPIQLYQISDVEMNQDIPVGMLQKFPTIAYLPEGPGNFNLVRVYDGPMTTMAIDAWIKTLPAVLIA